MANSILTAYRFLLILLVGSNQLCSSAQSCMNTQLDRNNLQKLTTANNLLALNLYRSLAHGSLDNMFFSPLSISTAFATLFFGTRGDTAQELRQALGYSQTGLNDAAVHTSFKCLLSQISSDPSYTLRLPNAILLDSHLLLRPDYMNSIRFYYNSIAEVADFHNHPESVKNVINSWVRKSTNGKIEKLLDNIRPRTAMLLLNAVYFKGKWKIPFNPKKTQLRTFYNMMHQQKPVHTMNLKADLRYTSNEAFQALELPYEGVSNISMLILLPSRKLSLTTFENSLTLQRLTDIHELLRKQKVQVYLPKFTLADSRELTLNIHSLGARRIFYPHYADFSGISPSQDVVVSQVLHKAFVEVNEEGSEAAAATGLKIGFRRRKREYSFVVDRPFVFSIIWNEIIVFMGRVSEI